MKVRELIEQLNEMPQDYDVCFWVGEKRVDIIEVRDCGDVVDLYEEEEANDDDGVVRNVRDWNKASEHIIP